MKRSKAENEMITTIALYIGKSWPAEFVPEDDLLEAINEFLSLPHPETLLELILRGDLIMHVEIKKREGCWLSFELPQRAAS